MPSTCDIIQDRVGLKYDEVTGLSPNLRLEMTEIIYRSGLQNTNAIGF